ncbi:hypothetical protein SAMN04489727_1419 [Amycolatopsis tolypomycina]|uniref:PH domain-containing protein n=1 Tax=Amycolatopsis tolypomycina TaxID=208445 RepID=A0A1H4J1V7_9PSEU|nr:hypothetical protein [Amycolatopsis tolypomycina]SEB40217.1 hypothetical protein SAMN04489727_1419 [Amycolatopsis tolypomycina]
MTTSESNGLVVSRTAGRHWILAAVLLAIGAGLVWMGLSASQQSPRIAGCVFGGVFGLLALILGLRSLPEPVADELVLDASGISRVVGGVVWAARWGELRAVAVLAEPGRQHSFRVVLEPADARFAERHQGLTPVAAGQFLVPGITLSAAEAGRLREVAGRYGKVTERPVTPVPEPSRPPAVARLAPGPVPEPARVSIHVNGWDRRKLWLFDFAMVLLGAGVYVAAEFGPSGVLHTVCRILGSAVIVLAGVVHAFEFNSHKRTLRADLRLSNVDLQWKTYYRTLELSWREIAELRLLASGHLEFRPADPDFPLHYGDAEKLALGDGWYRLPRALSPAAARKFGRCAPTLLPREVVLTVGRGGAPPTPITRGAT